MKNLILTFIVVLLPFLGISQVSVDAEEIIQKLNNGEAAHYENVTIKAPAGGRCLRCWCERTPRVSGWSGPRAIRRQNAPPCLSRAPASRGRPDPHRPRRRG